MKTRNILFSSMVLVAFCSDLHAQYTLRGEIFSRQDDGPVSYANVLVINAVDSSFTTGTVSNLEGIFELRIADSARHFLIVRMLGYMESEKIILEPRPLKRIDLGRIYLAEDTHQLEEVIIHGQKPLLEIMPDRLIVNVKNNLTSHGKSALEILRQAPGVVIDPNGTVNLNGKIGAGIMLNGRLLKLTPEMAGSFLEGLAAGNIEKIELIHSPDARFDSQGEAGIVSIITAERINEGFNGSIFTSAGYYWKPKYGAGGNINFVRGKFSMSAQYSFNRNYTRTTWDNFVHYKAGVDSLHLTGLNTRQEKKDDQSGMLQIDYRMNANTTAGANFFMGIRDYRLEGDAPSYRIRNSLLEDYVETVYSERNKWSRLGSNLNIRHAISKSSQLNLDADHLYFYNSIPVLYSFGFYHPDNSLADESAMRTQKSTPITVNAIKIDYAKKISDNINVSAGFKFTSSYFDNRFTADTLAESEWVRDLENSSRYRYREKVPSAFLSVDLRPSEADILQLGLRYEATLMDISAEGFQKKRTFVNLFPHFSWTRKVTSGTINVTFTRRVNRPGYWDLAPFAIFLGPHVFVSGNESLRPSLSNSFTVGYNHPKVDLSLNYNYNEFTIANYQNYVDVDREMLMSNAQNLKSAEGLYLNIKIPFSAGKVWESFNTITGSFEKVSAQYPYFRLPVEKELLGYKLSTTNTFKLPKQFKLELSGYYNSAYLAGISRHLGFGMLNAGVSKQIKNQVFSLNVSDILWNWGWNRDTFLPAENLDVSMRYKGEPRVMTLTYRYNFGNDKVFGLKKRNTASEDEQNRL